MTPTRGTVRPTEEWALRLYVVGGTWKSTKALANLRRICEEHIPTATIEVVDLVAEPERASVDDILVIPTLVRRLPEPVQKIIGDLSDVDRVLMGLRVSLTEEARL